MISPEGIVALFSAVTETVMVPPDEFSVPLIDIARGLVAAIDDVIVPGQLE
jgi:hypothetical protein